MDEGKGDKFGEPVRIILEIPQETKMLGPVSGNSYEPYMMVAVDRRPIPCASLIIRTQSAVGTLRGQITSLTESTRISAAVPWMVPSPSSFSQGQARQ